MCGRYVQTRTARQIATAFDALVSLTEGAEVRPSWNIPRTVMVPIVRERAGRETGDVERHVNLARWGLVPPWTKDLKAVGSTHNAKSETVTEKPTFRRAARQRRCVVPADGYFEWQKLPGGGKQPYYLHAPDTDDPLAFAGLWETWRNPEHPDDHPEAWLRSCTILTTTASDTLGHVHDRSPVILPPEMIDTWLDPALTDPGAVRDLLTEVPEPTLTPRPVGRAVGNVRNNRPEVIAAIEPEA